MHKQDKEALQFLSDVCATKKTEPSSVTIELSFSANPFFSNPKLSYTVKENDSNEATEVEGCVIDWLEGKNLTLKKIKKKQKHKKTNETRTIVKTVPTESFFNLFESKKAPADVDKDAEDVDSDDEKILMQLEEAHDVANDLFDMYHTDALEYYLNFGQNFQDLMGGMQDQEFSDGDEEDEDEKPKKCGKKQSDASSSSQASAAPDGEVKPECKQQ